MDDFKMIWALLRSKPFPAPTPFGVSEWSDKRLFFIIPVAFVYRGSIMQHASLGFTRKHAVNRAEKWRFKCMDLGLTRDPEDVP